MNPLGAIRIKLHAVAKQHEVQIRMGSPHVAWDVHEFLNSQEGLIVGDAPKHNLPGASFYVQCEEGRAIAPLLRTLFTDCPLGDIELSE